MYIEAVTAHNSTLVALFSKGWHEYGKTFTHTFAASTVLKAKKTSHRAQNGLNILELLDCSQ